MDKQCDLVSSCSQQKAQPEGRERLLPMPGTTGGGWLQEQLEYPHTGAYT